VTTLPPQPPGKPEEKPADVRPFLVRLFASYLPATGLLGLAMYQLLTEHHWDEAFQTLGEAAVLFGMGRFGGMLFDQHKKTQEAIDRTSPRAPHRPEDKH
jgi:hypothetical protein